VYNAGEPRGGRIPVSIPDTLAHCQRLLFLRFSEGAAADPAYRTPHHPPWIHNVFLFPLFSPSTLSSSTLSPLLHKSASPPLAQNNALINHYAQTCKQPASTMILQTCDDTEWKMWNVKSHSISPTKMTRNNFRNRIVETEVNAVNSTCNQKQQNFRLAIH
jgi:hypothetical protein